MSAIAPKTLMVTGASRGIGAATARLAATRGYDVCVNFHRSEDAAIRLVDEIGRAGGRAIAVRADIGDEREVARLFETATAELGPVDALVNNAGIDGGRTRVADLNGETLRAVFSTNVFGAFYCCREAIRRMASSSGGHGGGIVNVSSQAANFGGVHLASYASSKAALNTLTVALAREVAADGIRVNAVSPGLIDTDMLKSTDPARRAELIAGIPSGRFGRPDEVAEMILWLLSDAASYVSGAIVPISGGR